MDDLSQSENSQLKRSANKEPSMNENWVLDDIPQNINVDHFSQSSSVSSIGIGETKNAHTNQGLNNK